MTTPTLRECEEVLRKIVALETRLGDSDDGIIALAAIGEARALLVRMEQKRNHLEDWFGPGDFRADYPEPAPPQEIVTKEIVLDALMGFDAALRDGALHRTDRMRAALLAVIPKLKERMGHE